MKYGSLLGVFVMTGCIVIAGVHFTQNANEQAATRRNSAQRTFGPRHADEQTVLTQSADAFVASKQTDDASEVSKEADDANPATPDEVGAMQLISELHQLMGDVEYGRSLIEDAMQLLDIQAFQDPLQVQCSVMRIDVSLSNLVILRGANIEIANRSYDQLFLDQFLLEADFRALYFAAEQAALVLAESGQYADAAANIDRLFEVPGAMDVLADRELSLRAMQASWFGQAGDSAESRRRWNDIWEGNPGSDQIEVLQAGLNLARAASVPGECDTRLSLCRTLLSRIDSRRSRMPVGTSLQLDEIERQVNVAIAGSTSCGDVGLVHDARRRLGLE